MPTKTPIAYNTGGLIPGTTQIGFLAVGSSANRYDTNPGDVKWWMGPDEDLGYVIAKPLAFPRPTGDGFTQVAFNRSSSLSDASFKALAETIAAQGFLSAADAKTWLNANGYWTSYTSNTAEFYYDPGNTSSYPGTGTTLTNIGTLGNITGTLGTLSGVAYESGTAGGAFNFDGVADRIQFGQYNFGDTITVNAWVYPRVEASINCLMANCGANTQTLGFKAGWNNWNTTNYTMNFEAGNGTTGNTSSTAANTIVANTWQMITYVFNRTAPSIKFYKNGVEIATATGGSPVSGVGVNNSNWWMGAIGGSSYYMNANMGLFKIWKSIVSDASILNEFNNTKSRYGL